MKKLYTLMILCLLSTAVMAATTGKITGIVSDTETGEPLIGVNVLIPELGMGAATDVNGFYAILNVPPGAYEVTANYIGYTSVTFREVRVRIDLTTTQNYSLSTQALEGEAVVIEATKPVVDRDVASSQRNMSADELVDMPITSVAGVVGLQAGVEGLSIRGGGTNEMTLMVDGITLKDDRTGNPITGISLTSVKEVMVQSGGFNAEYSDLQSGLVSIVTREGAKDRYSFSFSYRHSPAAPKHFGMSLFDKNSYFLRPYFDDEVAWTGTEQEEFTDLNGNDTWDAGEPFDDENKDGQWAQGWDEYTQARYPSFKGWNGVAAQMQKEGIDITPAGAQRLFEWQSRKPGNILDPDYTIDMGLGGPVPVLGKTLGNMRFFASYRGEQTMYLFPLSRDGKRDWTGTLRLTSDISPKIKLSMSALRKEISASTSSGTGQPSYFSSTWGVASIFGTSSQQSWKLFAPEYYALTDISTTMLSAKLTGIIDSKSFYEGIVEYSNTGYNSNPNPFRDTTTYYDIFPGDGEFLTDEAPYGFVDFISESVGGVIDMGLKSNARDTSTTSRFKMKFDYTTQFNQNNQIKTGAQFEYFDYDMNYGAINKVLPSGRPFSTWHRSPYQLGLYVQDKIEFEGWVASVGLRAEYFNPNTDWYDVDIYDKSLFSSSYDPEQEDAIPTAPAKSRWTFLPRIGISHPISVNSKLYFNYGHMRQKFNPDYLFGVRRVTGGQMSSFGDPELPMEKTVAYEMGYDHSLFDKYLIHISGYYKDKSDQASTVRYYSADNTVAYSKYENIFYQDIRGLELEVRKMRGDWLTGFANYTVTIASSGYFGVRRFYQNPSEQREELSLISRQVQAKPLPRPRVNFNTTFHTPKNFGPKIAGDHLLGDWHLAFNGYWKAGSWAKYGNRADVINNVRWKDTYNVNSRLSKTYRVGNVGITLLGEAFNLFNFKHFTTLGMARGTEYTKYQNSLQFNQEVYDELGMKHVTGDDRYGDYRPDDVDYQPMDYLNDIALAYDASGNVTSWFKPSELHQDLGTYFYSEANDAYYQYAPVDDTDAEPWKMVSNADVKEAQDSKAYIYNPPNSSLTFLSPRDLFFGVKLSYNF